MNWFDIGISVGCFVIVCLLYYYYVYLPAKQLALFLTLDAAGQANYLTTVTQSTANTLVSNLKTMQLVVLYGVAIESVATGTVLSNALLAMSDAKQLALFNALTGYSVPGLLVYNDRQLPTGQSLCPTNMVVSSIESAYYGADNMGGVPPVGSCQRLDVKPIISKYIGTNQNVSYSDMNSVFTDPCPSYTKSLIANYTCGAIPSKTLTSLGPKIGPNAIATTACTSGKC